MTAPPGKSGIRLKREIWTWTGVRTRIAQVLERRAQIFLLRSYKEERISKPDLKNVEEIPYTRKRNQSLPNL